MSEFKKTRFNNSTKNEKNLSYILDILRKFGVVETEDSIILPDEVLKPIIDAEISSEVYDYFQLVWANEECEIFIEDIVGSHDDRNLFLKTWFENFLVYDVGQSILEKYLSSPKSIYDSKEHPLRVFEIAKKYYIADGHHRFSTLHTHYHILKSQNKVPADFPLTLKGIKRVVPTNQDFVKRFINFCLKHHLYYEDEYGVIPYFEIVDSTPDYPIIRYSNTDIIINPDANLEEVISKIKEEDQKRKK